MARGFKPMNGRISNSILGFVGVVLISIVTAAIYVGGLEERVKSLETWAEDDGERTRKALESFVRTPRRAGSAVDFANSGRWGEWSDAKFCPEGYYVCGMKQSVEPPQGSGSGDDDTAMNAVAFFCCPLDPSGDPMPE